MSTSSFDNFSAKDVNVEKGLWTLNEFCRRWKAGTFREVLGDWKWIFSYTAHYKKAVVFYLFLGLLSTCSSQLSSYLNIDIVDIVTGKQTDRLWVLIVVSVLGMILSLTVGNYLNRVSTKIGIDINNDIQSDIFGKIMDSDWLAINKYTYGDILNRFNDDIGTISSNAISWLPTIVIAFVNLAITLAIMINIDPVVALLVFISAPFTLLASNRVVKKQREYGRKVREMNSEMMSYEVETFYNMDTIKSFGIADQYSERLHGWQKLARKIKLDYNTFTIKTNIYMSLVGYLASSICFFYCLFKMWNGQITYGQMTYILTQRSALTTSFSNIISMIPNFLIGSVSAHRVRELSDLPKEVHIPASSEMDRHVETGFSIAMKGVSFAYAEGNDVITESDFHADPGEIIALVGPSGEGKTTMIRLILGLVHPETGSVTLKAEDGSSVEMNADTRHLFSYVPQGNTILLGTVAENMRMVKRNATDEEIIEALKMACAWEFIKDLPETINCPIGEKGKGFSEGQAQRIAIARALLRNSPVLLLDEATSALDVATERLVLRNIIGKQPNKTVIVTTHRPSVLNMCKRVYRIMDQKITTLNEDEASRMTMDF